MFALKQSARCLSRLQFNVLPKLPLSCLLPVSSVVRQGTLAISNTSFSQSNNLATAAQKTGVDRNKKHKEHAPIQDADPDVLYHMIEIELRAPEPAVMKSYNEFVSLAASHLGLIYEHCPVTKKYETKRWTVLKSRHGHRKHMVTYEVRTYHHIFQVHRVTGSTADTFLEYIQRNLPEGVAMRVGRVRMEKLPEHLIPPPPEDKTVDSTAIAAKK